VQLLPISSETDSQKRDLENLIIMKFFIFIQALLLVAFAATTGAVKGVKGVPQQVRLQLQRA
jgi:hypothetical protein